ncbi:MAG: hypothetical protein FJX62_06945 [Alphaproteobacteria bacterium]|nr:hypothetical protein [Alphaproteobacteria bacterium]
MRNLFGKVAVTAGSAVVAGALLVVAYVSVGVAVLAFLLTAIFWIGEDVVPLRLPFVPIGIAALVVFGLASWALTAIGTGAWWLWRSKPPGNRQSVEPPPR